MTSILFFVRISQVSSATCFTSYVCLSGVNKMLIIRADGATSDYAYLHVCQLLLHLLLGSFLFPCGMTDAAIFKGCNVWPYHKGKHVSLWPSWRFSGASPNSSYSCHLSSITLTNYCNIYNIEEGVTTHRKRRRKTLSSTLSNLIQQNVTSEKV